MVRSSWRDTVVVLGGLLSAFVLGVTPAGAGALPDGRGYELVSPPAKLGGDVMAYADHTQVADSGDAVSFVSLTPFADAVGSGIATSYVSERTGRAGTNGWATHAITPPVNPISFGIIVAGGDTEYMGDFSTDLSKGILRTFTPLTDDPNVAAISNVYLRTDVLTPGPGSYALLSACPACTSPLPDRGFTPVVAGVTPDLGHVLFEAHDPLTADAPPGGTLYLYDWDHGTIRFVGILPDGSAATFSMAGAGAATASYTLNTISDDGSKVFFTVPTQAPTGDLYMRVDHATTVQLNASERTPPTAHQPALYMTASRDGSKVFFQDPEQLTNTAGGDLYAYDATLPASDPNHLQHIFTDHQPADGTATNSRGVLGASADGSYVYFLVASAILPNQAPLPSATPYGIYLWHNGTITFIGSIDSPSAGIGTLPGSSVIGFNSRVTPDGHALLFSSYTGTGLTGYDHGQGCARGPCQELYLYHADTGHLACISCNPTGAPATADAAIDPRASIGGLGPINHLNHPLTDDGQHVFFETGEALVPQDVNSKADVYEYDTADGSLHLITTGTSPDDSHFLNANPTGQDVFFTTNQQLVGWDTDNSYDLYDARVGGGLPNPAPVRPECAGEACQGPVSGPSPAGTPSTGTFSGPGNAHGAPPKHAKRCGRGKVRRRVHHKLKCVRKRPRNRQRHRH